MRRSQWLSLLSGLLVGVLITLSIPAMGATDDFMVLGRMNKASRITALSSGGSTTVKIVNTKTGIPLQLQGSAAVPPLSISSGVKVRYRNADMLDGSSSVVLAPRASTALILDAPNGPLANEDVLTTEIQIPAAGLLLITGKMELRRSAAGADNLGCRFMVDNTEVLGSKLWIELLDTDGGREDNCVNSGFHYASTGGTYMVDFNFWNVATGTELKEGTLWVLWVPVDGSISSFFDATLND